MASSGNDIKQIDTGILRKDACVIIVRTEWNDKIVGELERGCIAVLQQHGLNNYKVIEVPGAFEIPFAIKCYHDNYHIIDERADVFIALACVIRGGTPHFDYVCKAITDGVLQLNLQLPVPTIFGVLTVENEQQALDRVGGSDGHKGEEAALTAIKMLAYVASNTKIQ